ncbi:MAG TPA: hypothetical protein VMV34_05295 [Terriglobia bacterium]|nr:hypothetical protein [Terriglobia bacterium]
MKRAFLFFSRILRAALCGLLVLLCWPSSSHSGPPGDSPTAPRERIWKSTGSDDGSVHCLGDGKLIAYEQGPEIIQVFGPPYVAPTALSVRLEASTPTVTHSWREPGAAIWHHEIFQDAKKSGALLDFADSESPLFLRRIQADAPLHFHLHWAKGTAVVQNGDRYASRGAAGGALIEIPAGRPIFMNYLTHLPEWYQLVWTGKVQAKQQSPTDLMLTVEPGESSLAVVSGDDYPAVVHDTEAMLASGVNPMLERTRAHWQRFSRARTDFGSRINSNVPDRDQLLRTVDDVAVLLAAQRSDGGGVLAGHNYHWFGVRDQYGVGRTLLFLGEPDRARAIYDFYWSLWQRYHVLHNGQGMEPNMFFHVHENDGVEIPGYLIMGAFDILATTHDERYVEKIFPMLEWAWEVQKENLVLDMLPFNGDETYVAGGLLPRSALNDGSAEATLLFLESGKKLVNWAEQHHKWQAARLAAARGVLDEVQRNYRKNFWRDGRLITNNPERAARAPLPRFRHGVCERCMAEKRFKHLTWNERSSTGRYLCPVCMAKGPYPAAPVKIYALASVSLLPFYFHSSLFRKEELAPIVRKLANDFLETGSFRGADAPAVPGKIVGYDLGMLLYALTELHDPLAGPVYSRVLQMVDPTGAWAEYYLDGQPRGTRCRPWESAINLEALLHYGAQGK